MDTLLIHRSRFSATLGRCYHRRRKCFVASKGCGLRPCFKNIMDKGALCAATCGEGQAVKEPAESPEKHFFDVPFRGIIEQTIAGVFVIQDKIYKYVNSTFSSSLGRTPDEIIGAPLHAIIAPEGIEQADAVYERQMRSEIDHVRFCVHAVHKDGHIVYIDVHGSRLLYKGRVAIVGIGVDVSDRVLNETALRESQERLRELAAHINSMREEQRARFAREIHDGIGGMLTSIKMDITRILRRAHNEEQRTLCENLLQLTKETIDETRRISNELRPGVLDHLGLNAAIAEQLAQCQRRWGWECSLDVASGLAPLPECKSTAVYRIFQEALTNIARHADATQVVVRLRSDQRHFEMDICDNGCGIDLSSPKKDSIGLLSMAERAREIGGQLNVGHCSGGHGTELQLTVPLSGGEGHRD